MLLICVVNTCYLLRDETILYQYNRESVIIIISRNSAVLIYCRDYFSQLHLVVD